MNRKELIEIAKSCANGQCRIMCPFLAFGFIDEYNNYCQKYLLNKLAEELETATHTIPVGNGEDYKVVRK